MRTRRAILVLLLVVGGMAALSFWIEPVHGYVVAPQQVTVTATGVASTTQFVAQKFWQNTTAVYGTGSTKATVVSTFANYSSIQSFSVSVTTSMFAASQGVMIPMRNVTQTGTVLTNVTTPDTLSVAGSVGNVFQKVPAAFKTNGLTPDPGQYNVFSNATQTISFSRAAAYNWSWSGAGYRLAYVYAAPASYQLNQSTIFFPFPAVAVNYSSLNVTQGARGLPLQATANGASVFVNGVAAGGKAFLNVSFRVVPSTGPVPPVLTLGRNIPLSATRFQASANWTNGNVGLYGGIVLVQLPSKYTWDPSSIALVVNNSILPAGAFLVSGNTVTILPQILTIPLGSTIRVTAQYNLLFAPPTATLVGTTVLANAGPFAVTFAALMVALLFVIFLAMIGSWAFWKSTRGFSEFTWTMLGLFVLVALVLLVSLFVQVSPS